VVDAGVEPRVCIASFHAKFGFAGPVTKRSKAENPLQPRAWIFQTNKLRQESNSASRPT